MGTVFWKFSSSLQCLSRSGCLLDSRFITRSFLVSCVSLFSTFPDFAKNNEISYYSIFINEWECIICRNVEVRWVCTFVFFYLDDYVFKAYKHKMRWVNVLVWVYISCQFWFRRCLQSSFWFKWQGICFVYFGPEALCCLFRWLLTSFASFS